jgi:hypothetical protein
MTMTAANIVNHGSYYNNRIFFNKGWQDRMNGYERFNPWVVEDSELDGMPDYARMALEDYTDGWDRANLKIKEMREAHANAAVFVNSWI